MFETIQAVSHYTPVKTIQPSPKATNPIMAWIPVGKTLDNNHDEIIDSTIDRLIHVYAERNQDQIGERLLYFADRWKAELKRFIPPFPMGTIVLTADQEKYKLIPVRYKCKRAGIEKHNKGWKELIDNLTIPSSYRMAVLGNDKLELFKIIDGNPHLEIELNAVIKNRKQTLDQFCHAINILQKYDDGPLITSGVGNGIHEMDLWILSNKIATTADLLQQNTGQELRTRTQNIHRIGQSSTWIRKWLENEIERAKELNKWIGDEFKIRQMIHNNRVKTIVMNTSASGITRKNAEYIPLLFQNNVQMFTNYEYGIGAILK